MDGDLLVGVETVGQEEILGADGVEYGRLQLLEEAPPRLLLEDGQQGVEVPVVVIPEGAGGWLWRAGRAAFMDADSAAASW